uniref:(California timema) hypothetical protein n=1 Tax=Timema californicum TaxID=61474 RepID=A0A7R9PBY9_TIMCA|nr:unnamed protein product [Timema californicum]
MGLFGNCEDAFGVQMENVNMRVLLYADEVVLLAESESDLKNALNHLNLVRARKDLRINVTKTKCYKWTRNGDTTIIEHNPISNGCRCFPLLAPHLNFFLLGKEGRWRKLRGKLTPSFTSSKMRMMLPTIVGCSQDLVSFLGESADDNNIIEIRNVAANFTTDSFAEWEIKVFQPTFLTGALRSLGLIFRPILNLVQPPIARKDVNDFFLGIVKETMTYREKNKVVRDDFLQYLIQLKNKGKVDEDLVSIKDDINMTVTEVVSSSNEGEDEPLEMTDTLLAAQCLGFFLAGFETTSTTISCCLHELAVNPNIQEKLRKEVDTVLINHGGQITYEALQDLKYMDAVVDETLRKYPPVGNISRLCTKGYQIPDTNVNIDKEIKVVIPVYAIHHDPKYYPDPEKFDPKRFSPENIKSQSSCTYLPFGEGPRNCIGLRFGLMQVKVGLTALLSKYKFSVCEKTSIPLTFNPISFITLWPRDIHLKISHRDN